MTDEELNRLVAEKVMGWVHNGFVYLWFDGDDFRGTNETWKPLERIEQAWLVVEKMRTEPLNVQTDFLNRLAFRAWYDCQPSNLLWWLLLHADTKREIILAALAAKGVEAE